MVLGLMAYNPPRASVSPSSATSSCHKDETKKSAEFLGHFISGAHNYVDSDCGTICGSPTLWLALSIYLVLSTTNEEGRMGHILKHVN